MLAVVIAAGAIWAAGNFTGAPRRTRWMGIAVLWVAVVAIQLILPDGHALRQSTGESAAPWLLFAGAGALIWGYMIGLNRLRQRARPQPSIKKSTTSELERNARHIVLREIGGPGQAKLKEAKVLVVGAGGLGSPVLGYLAAAGVGTVGVIDDDVVDNSNLSRQIIHNDADIGVPKVFSAEAAMKAQNPRVEVRPYHRRLTDDIAHDLFADYDLILDGTDNFDTRYLVNRAAVTSGKPLISGAISQWEGQVSLYDPAVGAPCYECIFPTAPAPGLVPSCAEAGVVAPLPGVVGSIMAVEAIKFIAGAGETLAGRLLIYDGLYGEARVIKLTRRADCPVCGALDAGASTT